MKESLYRVVDLTLLLDAEIPPDRDQFLLTARETSRGVSRLRGRNWKGRNIRSEMKVLQCPRCHENIRLDKYSAHIATCPQPAIAPSTAA